MHNYQTEFLNFVVRAVVLEKLGSGACGLEVSQRRETLMGWKTKESRGIRRTISGSNVSKGTQVRMYALETYC